VRPHVATTVCPALRHLANGLLEGINSLVQAAKARARGYRNKNKMITIIYLTAAKLPLPTLTNPKPAYLT
jgi:transposase